MASRTFMRKRHLKQRPANLSESDTSPDRRTVFSHSDDDDRLSFRLQVALSSLDPPPMTWESDSVAESLERRPRLHRRRRRLHRTRPDRKRKLGPGVPEDEANAEMRPNVGSSSSLSSVDGLVTCDEARDADDEHSDRERSRWAQGHLLGPINLSPGGNSLPKRQRTNNVAGAAAAARTHASACKSSPDSPERHLGTIPDPESEEEADVSHMEH